jgi:hypothetical protein
MLAQRLPERHVEHGAERTHADDLQAATPVLAASRLGLRLPRALPLSIGHRAHRSRERAHSRRMPIASERKRFHGAFTRS